MGRGSAAAHGAARRVGAVRHGTGPYAVAWQPTCRRSRGRPAGGNGAFLDIINWTAGPERREPLGTLFERQPRFFDSLFYRFVQHAGGREELRLVRERPGTAADARGG